MSRRIKRNHSPYKSPLQRLDEKAKRYSPKKLLENYEYKKLADEGKCSPFEKPPSSYRYFHIHAETTIDTIDDLIDYANEITTYTVDTEDQMRFRQESLGALIQIEFIYPNNPTIIILIETLHLPPQNSTLFGKISRLCKTIFKNGHRIYGWGKMKQEMNKMYRYNLFNIDDTNGITEIDVQSDFKRWFNETNPTSMHRKTADNDKFSLQKAIYLTFNEWLDKRLTLADWGCALDVKSSMFTDQNHQIINDEIHIRQLMILYAMNDCFSVTKLAHYLSLFDRLKSPRPTFSEETLRNKNDDTEPMMVTDGIHVRDEFPETTIGSNELHEINEADHPPKITEYLTGEVHVRNELRHDIEMISNDGYEQNINEHEQDHVDLHNKPILTRNQRKNRKKRANRYRYEIIRPIYHRFTITHIKKILINMNIHYVNINIVGKTLFIGLRNEKTREWVNQLLHDDMFNAEHFRRIEQRRKRHHSIPAAEQETHRKVPP